MRQVLRVAAFAAAGLALLSCARHPPEPLPPPPGADAQASGAPYGRADYPDAGAGPGEGYGESGYGEYQPPRTYGGASYGQSAPPPPPPSYYRPRYAQSPQVIRPPVYAPPRAPTSYGRSAYAAPPPRPANGMVWRPSPRWATVKKKPAPTAKAPPPAPVKPKVVARAKPVTPKPDPDAKFKAAQTKAEEVGVENLSQEDIAGLTPDQLKLLRGY